MTNSTPLWCDTRLDAHIIRTQDSDGDLNFYILVPGAEGGFGIRCSGEAEEQYKGQVLANVGKLIKELKEFAKQIENLPSEPEEL